VKRPILALATGAVIIAPAAKGDHGVARWRCPERFTVQMDERAARAIYRDTRTVTYRNLRLLGRLEMCQRNPAARGFARWYNHQQAALHDQRVYDATRPYSSAVATYFDDAGATASGEHFTYGFASCGSEGMGCVPFGTRIEFCWQSRCVIGQREDSGPYGAAGFDLNQNMAGAIGMVEAGRISLTWRVLG
jgi:hypothetical protein